MLYRMDTPNGPVCDLVGPRLLTTYSLARIAAEAYADNRTVDVTVTQITNAGRLNPKAKVDPEGIWQQLDKPRKSR